ncbi:hypothetical protein L596_026549 [Steinernema carpocapsae]|uniref:Uncharacterized protein n=1 Tax=Steinernema carpocapsae TaxID=34508 RepID=A0A4U5M1Q0_STECR|nr:hypothetical protein L596_026549 [Steinernema carpocapsae]
MMTIEPVAACQATLIELPDGPIRFRLIWNVKTKHDRLENEAKRKCSMKRRLCLIWWLQTTKRFETQPKPTTQIDPNWGRQLPSSRCLHMTMSIGPLVLSINKLHGNNINKHQIVKSSHPKA